MKGMHFGEGTGSAKKYRATMAPNQQMMGNRTSPMMKEKLTDKEKTKIAQTEPSVKRPGGGADKNKLNKSFEGSVMKYKDSALKSDWDTALKNDPNLNNLVTARNDAKKKYGKKSDEYATAQNRVNVAYENAKRHGVKTDTTSKTDKITGRTKEQVTTTTPGVGSEVVTTTTGKKGNVVKTKGTSTKDDYYVGEGEAAVTHTKTKPSKDKEMNTEDDKVKTRNKKRFRDTKLGRTKVGQKFVKKENRR